MLKSKYNYIICFLCACLFFLCTSNVYASNDSKPVVEAYKVWNIKFNQPVKFDTISNKSIQVKDKRNNSVDVGLRLGAYDNVVIVTPPKEGYNLGEEYTLIITKELCSENNKHMKDEKNFDFKIKEVSEKPIVFKDDIFESMIRDKTRKPMWEPIYKSDVENITELQLEHYEGIKDISGIENLVNLKSLDLTYSQIEDISALKGLTNLQELILYDNKIKDITALKGLTNLKDLELYGNQITDITPLKGLTNLEWIDLANNKITDTSPLEGLTNLTELKLYYNPIDEDCKQTLKKYLPKCDIKFN